MLIVAGAGTGKTTVLTRRIAHLITTKRARPEEILALTFTEKAAREMSERVDQLVPYGYTESFIATFHLGDPINPSDSWRPWRRRAALHKEVRLLVMTKGTPEGSAQRG